MKNKEYTLNRLEPDTCSLLDYCLTKLPPIQYFLVYLHIYPNANVEIMAVTYYQ